MTSIVEMVRHYQRSIEKSQDNSTRLMHCIQKLNKLPITVEHLQETGVGRTVNNLRKYEGEVAYAAKALVTKWKAMVATEESQNDSHEEEADVRQMETQDNCQDDDDDEDDEHDPENQLHIDETENIEPVESSSEEQASQRIETSKNQNNDNHHKKSSKHSSDSKKHSKHHKSDKKHSHKDRERHSSSEKIQEGQNKDKSHRKDKDKSSTKEHRKDDSNKKSKSSGSETKHHSSNSSQNKDTEKSESSHKSDSHRHKKSSKNETNSSNDETKESHAEKRDRKDEKKESRSHDSKKSSKKDKESEKDSGKKRKRDSNEIVIDSTMGASFADALGFLDKPSSSKVKKLLNERPSTSAAQSSTENKSSSKKSSSGNTSSSTSNNNISNRNLMKEPELLMKRPKLDPLPDIVAEIQPSTITISNNYKPMPLNQTVMDCVFNQSSKPTKLMTDEEALTYSISSNKSRTKVYSGVKTGSRGKVDSLFNMCIHVLQDHIDYLEYTGGVPFDILKPVLERATVEQLLSLEDYNPYLIEDSDCLWEQHCKRRFRGKRPEEMESWREMFLRCIDEEQVRLQKLTHTLKLSRDKKLPVRQTKLAYVDSVVKPPRGVKSKQMKYGTDTLPNVTPAARVEALKNIGGNTTTSIGDRRLKIAAELRNSIPTRKRSKSYEDDPDWTPTSWYKTLHKKRKPEPKQPVVKKTIDMIRYDRARAEAKRKEEERRQLKARAVRSESAPD
uniref:CSON013174 protein n=1 Tax=Culicoides sonorensis TaxID=179676 RepID=A0A336KP71_CULSO